MIHIAKISASCPDVQIFVVHERILRIATAHPAIAYLAFELQKIAGERNAGVFANNQAHLGYRQRVLADAE